MHDAYAGYRSRPIARSWATPMKDCPTHSLAFDHFDLDDEQRREALFTLANGVISWRACSPEACAVPRPDGHYPGLYRAGWYDDAARQVNGTTTHTAALVNLPDPFGLTLSLNHQPWFELGPDTLQSYHQHVDMQRGVLTRRLSLLLADVPVELVETRFVSLANAQLAVLRWELHADKPLTGLRVRTTLDNSRGNYLIERDRDYEGRRLHSHRWEHLADGRAGVVATLEDASRKVAVAVQTVAPCQWQGQVVDDRLVQEGTVEWPERGPLVLEKRVIVQVDDEFHGLSSSMAALPDTSHAQLLAAHEQAWQDTWAYGRIRVADPAVDHPLQFAGWHIQQTVSALSTGHDLGFPARGWQEGYFGQVFWDELFAFPLFATHRPELASSLLDYRHARLPAARRRAARLGCSGAMFPWRSAHDGEEQTPPFQYYPISGNWVPDPTHLQRHIGSAVAYDAWTLYLATGDEQQLAGKIGDLIIEVARYWASVARFDESRQRYVIEGVIGPDEYHNAYPHAEQPGLDNNAYTNLMAVWTLCRALDVLQRLPTALREDLVERLALRPDEASHWEHVSRNMFLPFTADGVLDQFEGFERLQPAPDEWKSEDNPRLDWMLEARGDHCDHYQVSKQADTLMLFYLLSNEQLHALFARLRYPFDDDIARRTMDYHLGHVFHESSLSKTVCAGALAHTDSDASWMYYQHCLRTDLDAKPDSGVREGVHLAAMSGALDVMQRHYLGVFPAVEGLRVFPAPPPGLGDVSLAMQFHGQWVDVTRVDEVITVHLRALSTQPITLIHALGTEQLEPGSSVNVSG
ncbi:glycoside hydrolase family 65 protein [Pseudomonas sp. CFBP 13719]|uniref:glycoside hydrolase family 65 protein n=1 Tax=Pseudomonas sp. CFBP 13719 TaxID=2775303 RepID=UPI001FD56FD3|nr:glycoside hydrolase family 65 protein [Pseudomonas sp. CFBP 13719]